MFDDRPTYGLAQPRVQGAPTGFNVDLVRDACWPGDIGQTQADAQDHTPSTDTTIPTDHPPTSNPQPGNHPEHAPIGWMPDLTPDHRSPMAKLLDLARAILDRLPIDLIDTDHPTTGNP